MASDLQYVLQVYLEYFFQNFSATSGIEHNVNVNTSVNADSATECLIKSDTRLSSN